VWTADHVRRIAERELTTSPRITDDNFCRVSPNLDIWDAWPLQESNGVPAKLADGSSLWMVLGSPHFADPDERHAHARIHLLLRTGRQWRHLGPAMPEGFSPGSREWSGSAVLGADRTTVTLYFTATGRRGEELTTFEQRIFHARATLRGDGAGGHELTGWRDLAEIVTRDPAHYMASEPGTGTPGTIKAFRDPAYFRDPAEGRHYLLFAGSLAGSTSAFNGVVGVARAADDGLDHWDTFPPLLCADGLNNELERPHLIRHAGLYYLFWSTQRHVFNDLGPSGPTGLYGMVAGGLSGGWTPLNGTGLVFANPPEAPRQAYSWLVLPDLQVISFVDDWGAGDRPAEQRRFGAAFAPTLRLRLDGNRADLKG
jgi:levansucrase